MLGICTGSGGMTTPGMVAALTGLVPIIAIHSAYLVAAAQGHVPWCFPWFESCTSISATGRYGAAGYLFKGTMIPAAMLLMLYWHLMSRWLLSLGDAKPVARMIFVIGALGAIFLIIYTVALGVPGDEFRLQRRLGATSYFTLTYLSQLLVVWRMEKLLPGDATRPWLLGLCMTALAIGVATLVLDAMLANYDDYEDAFEWILALLVHLYFLVTVVTWKSFRVSYEAR